MLTDGLGQVDETLWAEVREAAQEVGGKLSAAVLRLARLAVGDGMFHTVQEGQTSFLRRQHGCAKPSPKLIAEASASTPNARRLMRMYPVTTRRIAPSS